MDVQHVHIGPILDTHAYEDIATTYNNLCADNTNLRVQLNKALSINDRLTLEEKSYTDKTNNLLSIIEEKNRIIGHNNQIYLASMELFQRQLRRVVAIKRDDSDTTNSVVQAGDQHIKQLKSELSNYYNQLVNFTSNQRRSHDGGINSTYSMPYEQDDVDMTELLAW